MRASPRYLPEFNYEERTETVNSRKTSFLFPPGFQHCHLELGPCSPSTYPGPGSLCSLQQTGTPQGVGPWALCPQETTQPCHHGPHSMPCSGFCDPLSCCPPTPWTQARSHSSVGQGTASLWHGHSQGFNRS